MDEYGLTVRPTMAVHQAKLIFIFYEKALLIIDSVLFASGVKSHKIKIFSNINSRVLSTHPDLSQQTIKQGQ